MQAIDFRENFSFAPLGLAHFSVLAPMACAVGCILSPFRGFFVAESTVPSGCGMQFSHAIQDVSFQNGELQVRTENDKPTTHATALDHCAGVNFRVRLVCTETGRPFTV